MEASRAPWSVFLQPQGSGTVESPVRPGREASPTASLWLRTMDEEAKPRVTSAPILHEGTAAPLSLHSGWAVAHVDNV